MGRQNNNSLILASDAFKDLDAKYGKVGVAIRGFRLRDELTQKELAEKLAIKQTHVSEIENSKRTVGKAMAHKLAHLFNIDYRLFL
jgi:transcriptional regulator with XRE-family HTH domain